MSYQGRRRAPRKRLLDRIRDWWYGWRYHWFGTKEVEVDAPWCASPWCSVDDVPHPRQPDCPGGDHDDYVGFYPDVDLTDDHGNPIGGDLPPVRPLIRTAEIGDGVYVPLSDDQPYNPAWAPCAFRQDVPRPGERNMPERGGAPRSGPGYLSAFAVPFGAPGRIPRTPRPPARPVLSRPRVPRYVLAGA